MKFNGPLIQARLRRRYKRFLTDVEMADGSLLTALCPNTGSLLGCQTPGSPVWLSHSDSITRKYAYTWELIQVEGASLVGINTQRSNALMEDAIRAGVVKELLGYEEITREVRYGSENSRIDLLLRADARPPCYLEVKNVTAAVTGGIALFPDAVSARGSKHLRELMLEVSRGHRAVIAFCVQRDDVHEVRPAEDIDPLYGKTLRQAIAHGVEAIAYRARITPEEITLVDSIPVHCP